MRLRGASGAHSTTAEAGMGHAPSAAPDPKTRLWEALERELPQVQRSVAVAVVSFLRTGGQAPRPEAVRELAEEALQEAVRRAFQKPEAFDPNRSSPHAWFYGIALNVLREHRRAGARARERLVRLDEPAALDRDGETPTIEDRLDDPAAEEPQRVMEILSLVDEPDRSLLAWRYMERATPAEIAARLHVREGTARARVSRALDRLEAAYHRAAAAGQVEPGKSPGQRTTRHARLDHA
jgi:RNA polymerase sigma factor (sigma-70 family)